jgi:hypothetical protein
MCGGGPPGSIADMRNTDVVTVRGLCKAYGDVWAGLAARDAGRAVIFALDHNLSR